MMIKKHLAYFAMVLIPLVIGSMAIAQTTTKPIGKPIVKFKPPVVKSYLGSITGKDAVAGVADAKSVILLPLRIEDEKKVTYTISSYQFAYKRIGLKEDEETGKATAESDLVANQFNITPLPAIWQTNIAETLHKGESLYFFDIIVMDKQGRRFFAPELKITIQ